ncbi:NUDIX domain-containing protein [Streptomyces sp. SL13]|uniref:NUDIX domain-containing protein n=1 Tax=Streptantibioticus silvisoli TaxID=2705255 RepID=A0AA90H6F0_9ACTN|nr:NUDIX hydrolase [Streptantibioticus silvisoli]MDI5965353.1 NUDIX domain-containing protein [Streptantibioticus silvisoli]MDI5972061.1 NUDIX domain-containing protein [Streptantibioticus silvisoli]
MIVWLNGAYGAGKTTTARELVDLIPTSTLYDPEATGQHLLSVLPGDRLEDLSGYQELASWRRLVVDTAAALLNETGGMLIVPAALLRQEHRDEVFGALAARGIPVRHLLLHADETILRSRAKQREDTAGRAEVRPPHAWSRDHLTAYERALPWLTRDAHVIDTSALTARQTAARIKAAVRDGAGACGIVQTPAPTGETLAAGVLMFDEEDRVLLVDPTYKPGWEFPGGVVERGEPPARAAVREVAEELGLDLAAGTRMRLLVVDWEPPRSPRYGGLRLLFDGGTLSADRTDELLLPAAELRGWRFVTEEEAADLLPPERFARLHWALRARALGRTVNLEAGEPVVPEG